MTAFRKIPQKEYCKYIQIADSLTFGKIYPLSIAECRQAGDIYTDGKAVLFHHLCGFGHIAGEADDAFINSIKDLMLNGGRRLVLFADNAIVQKFGEEFAVNSRFFFEYRKSSPPEFILPEGYKLEKLDSGLISQMAGRIVPAFSWESTENFLAGGTGFCVTFEDKPAAWAFSAAVNGEEVDVGVETVSEHRRKGLAFIAAAKTIEDILKSGRTPVWACHSENSGSAELALKLGFFKTAECCVIHKR
ncbi:MAG: GNAT family N-acetyltransferase [Ruminococcus sp.]|uniref:GNAT family N-acetyltransferase n=1 Tax=Ruminococcus sp. TaxID=41978 RepID=UPI0025EB2CB7|nr:GNAT family N-acetyltransferase [Ruminococcus sp.]MCR5540321.1 GNAT family N-acetyltransferase [Ruminococcus sp.]